MGLKDFLGGIDDAVVNTGKGLAKAVTYTDDVARGVLDPTKWDDTARFINEYGDDIAKVGWQIAKDQVNPTKADFWLNAATIGAGLATGGAGAAAITAARGARAAQTTAKAAKAIDAVSDVARAADAVNDVSKAAKTVEAVGEVARVADKTADVAKTGSVLTRGTEGMSFAEKAATGRRAVLTGNVREAMGMNRLSMGQRGRVAASNRFMNATEGATGATGQVRNYVGRSIAGQKGVMPSRRVGEAAKTASKWDDAYWTSRRLQGRVLGAPGKARGAGEYVEFASNPQGYAMDKALSGREDQIFTSTPYEQQTSDPYSPDNGPQGVFDAVDEQYPSLTQPPRLDGSGAARSVSSGSGVARSMTTGVGTPSNLMTTSQSAQSQPGASIRIGYGNQYSPRGWSSPGSMPTRYADQAREEQHRIQVHDPYARQEEQDQRREQQRNMYAPVRDPYARTSMGGA